MSVGVERQHAGRNGRCSKEEQCNRLMECIKRHVMELQRGGSVGKVYITLELQREGRLKSPVIKYGAEFEFVEIIEGLGA